MNSNSFQDRVERSRSYSKHSLQRDIDLMVDGLVRTVKWYLKTQQVNPNESTNDSTTESSSSPVPEQNPKQNPTLKHLAQTRVRLYGEVDELVNVVHDFVLTNGSCSSTSIEMDLVEVKIEIPDGSSSSSSLTNDEQCDESRNESRDELQNSKTTIENQNQESSSTTELTQIPELAQESCVIDPTIPDTPASPSEDYNNPSEWNEESNPSEFAGPEIESVCPESTVPETESAGLETESAGLEPESSSSSSDTNTSWQEKLARKLNIHKVPGTVVPKPTNPTIHNNVTEEESNPERRQGPGRPKGRKDKGPRKRHGDDLSDLAKMSTKKRLKIMRMRARDRGGVREKCNTRYKCPNCDKTFKHMHNYMKHLPVHSEIYKCEECQKVFKRKDYLDKHILMHRGDSRFKCDTCDKLFTLRAHLQEHALTHLAEKPLQCPHCPQKFNKVSNMKRHVRIKHEQISRAFACTWPGCGFDSPEQSDVCRHVREAHFGVRRKGKTGDKEPLEVGEEKDDRDPKMFLQEIPLEEAKSKKFQNLRMASNTS